MRLAVSVVTSQSGAGCTGDDSLAVGRWSAAVRPRVSVPRCKPLVAAHPEIGGRLRAHRERLSTHVDLRGYTWIVAPPFAVPVQEKQLRLGRRISFARIRDDVALSPASQTS